MCVVGGGVGGVCVECVCLGCGGNCVGMCGVCMCIPGTGFSLGALMMLAPNHYPQRPAWGPTE